MPLKLKGTNDRFDTTERCHYKIPSRNVEGVNKGNTKKKSLEEKEKQKILEKLHGQFYHPCEKSVKNLIMNAACIMTYKQNQ